MGYPTPSPLCQRWIKVPPPPPRVWTDTQTENIIFPHPSDEIYLIRFISIIDMSVTEISDTNLYQNGNGNNKSTECLTCLAAGDSVCDIVYCTSSETRFLSPSPRVISRTMVAVIFVAGIIVLIAVVWLIFQMDMQQCQVKKCRAAAVLLKLSITD